MRGSGRRSVGLRRSSDSIEPKLMARANLVWIIGRRRALKPAAGSNGKVTKRAKGEANGRVGRTAKALVLRGLGAHGDSWHACSRSTPRYPSSAPERSFYTPCHDGWR